jgi:predicted aspartyl protease
MMVVFPRGDRDMETPDVGRVLTEATIYNLGDLFEVSRGKLPADQVRKVVVTDALVDTGATTMCLTPSLISQLGLIKRGEKRTITAAGPTNVNLYDAVRVEIMGRDASVDPIEVPEGNPVLIGQIPLEMMDWVVDMRDHKLIGNPRHGGEHVIEMY